MSVELEKYEGRKTRHVCPNCDKSHQFTRYIGENGNYFADYVGKCNRESCGYHYTPKQFFADNPDAKKEFKPKFRYAPSKVEVKTVSFIDDSYFLESIECFADNNFSKGFLELFADRQTEASETLKNYFVGTYNDLTAFWQIDKSGKIRTAKLMRYDAETLKRQTVFSFKDKETGEPIELKTYWMHKALEKKGIVKDFSQETVFFGEHLLSQFPNKKIGVVEAEKTALICSMVFKDSLSDFIWLSAGSLGMMQLERLKRLGNRERFLFPDSNAFLQWSEKADEANKNGLTVYVSDLLEIALSDEEKKDGIDLADFLILEQRENLKNAQSESQKSRDAESAFLENNVSADFAPTSSEVKELTWFDLCGKCKSELDRIGHQWRCPKVCR